MAKPHRAHREAKTFLKPEAGLKLLFKNQFYQGKLVRGPSFPLLKVILNPGSGFIESVENRSFSL